MSLADGWIILSSEGLPGPVLARPRTSSYDALLLQDSLLSLLRLLVPGCRVSELKQRFLAVASELPIDKPLRLLGEALQKLNQRGALKFYGN